MMNNSSLSSIPPGLLTQNERRATLPQKNTIRRLAVRNTRLYNGH